MSKKQAADALGCSRMTYDMWERNVWTPGPEKADALGRFAGLPRARILGALGVLSAAEVEVLLKGEGPGPYLSGLNAAA
jgi:transcriptional regulator with XRE-family HTH domain